MPILNDVYTDLPRFSWRGIEVPLLTRSAGFQHSDARHKFLFRDEEFIEPLGAQNWTFRYSIPLRQGIAKGPYRDLFLEVYPRFVDACRERTPGELYDPVLGLYRCKPLSFEDESDVQRRDGDDVRVEFIWAPEEGILDLPAADLGNVTTARQEGAALDEAVGEIFRSKQLPGPEPSVNPLDAASGAINQISTAGDQLQAKFAATASKLQKVEDAVSKLEDPSLAPTIRATRNLRDAARQRAAKLLDPIGSVVTIVTSATTSLAAVASAAGLTPEELLKSNPLLAASPDIPPGTTIRYVAKS
jgi:DNA circularisation protein N-terminus